jgi:DNA polymerase-3 subunit beta
MTNNLECKEVKLEMSLPNRAGILRPLDGYSEDEELTMLVMPVMLNN